MWGRDTTDKPAVFKLLREVGAKYAVGTFSGGNDSGSVGEIHLYSDADQKRFGTPFMTLDWNDVSKSEWDPEQRKYVPIPMTPDKEKRAKLYEGISAPIYDRYGSFAGEFYVTGRITWDVDAEEVTVTGEEEVSTWQEISYTV